jgi:hypothetical protein
LVGKLESGLMRSPWLWPHTYHLRNAFEVLVHQVVVQWLLVWEACLCAGYANARFRFSPVPFFSMCWLALSVFPGWSSPFRSFHRGNFALCQWRLVSEPLAWLAIQLN